MAKKQSNAMSRRSVLSTLASAGGLFGVSTIGVSARNRGRKGRDFKDIVETAKRIRAKTGSMDKFRRYLQHHGISGKYKTHSFSPSRSGGLRPAHIEDDGALDISIGLVQNCLDYHGELFWSYNPQSSGWFHTDVGKPPMDGAGIFFESDWWNLDGATTEDALSTSYWVGYQDGSNGGDGPGFWVNDNNIFLYEDEGDRHYCGVYLTPTGNYDENERAIHGEYTHTWNDTDVELSSIGVSFPWGISLSWSESNSVKQWTTDTEDDSSTFLSIKQSEAYTSCY